MADMSQSREKVQIAYSGAVAKPRKWVGGVFCGYPGLPKLKPLVFVSVLFELLEFLQLSYPTLVVLSRHWHRPS